MKSCIVLLAGLFFTNSMFGQNQLTSAEDIKAPVYSDVRCFSIYDFLSQNLVYPDKAKRWEIEGTEVIRFQVTADGEINTIRVINSVSDDIDYCVIRALKISSGNWTPGNINGVPSTIEQEINVVFKIHESTDFLELAQYYVKKGNFMLYDKKKPGKALRFFNLAVKYMPNNIPLLTSRMFCKDRLGDVEGVIADRERINALAHRNSTMSFEEMIVVRGE